MSALCQSELACPYSPDTMGVELCVNKFFVCGAFWPFLLAFFLARSNVCQLLTLFVAVCCCCVLCGRSLICLKVFAVDFGMGKNYVQLGARDHGLGHRLP